jgi:pyruvate/2-oxoglutarate dehydrogenase complex dihydrolipoamide acyltransferase (E2) component
LNYFSKRSSISLSYLASIEAEETSNVERFQFDQVGKEEADRVKDIYYQYCNVYSKDIEESRFQIFLPNFLRKEAQAKESGKPLEMNKWYDCTDEEYKVGMQAEAAEEAARVLAEEEEEKLAAEATNFEEEENEAARDLAEEDNKRAAENASIEAAKHAASEHKLKVEEEQRLVQEANAKQKERESKFTLHHPCD